MFHRFAFLAPRSWPCFVRRESGPGACQHGQGGFTPGPPRLRRDEPWLRPALLRPRFGGMNRGFDQRFFDPRFGGMNVASTSASSTPLRRLRPALLRPPLRRVLIRTRNLFHGIIAAANGWTCDVRDFQTAKHDEWNPAMSTARRFLLLLAPAGPPAGRRLRRGDDPRPARPRPATPCGHAGHAGPRGSARKAATDSPAKATRRHRQLHIRAG